MGVGMRMWMHQAEPLLFAQAVLTEPQQVPVKEKCLVFNQYASCVDSIAHYLLFYFQVRLDRRCPLHP